eukprot:scaffold858_cov123-Cylindrotheca_fusiformis.AAC.25
MDSEGKYRRRYARHVTDTIANWRASYNKSCETQRMRARLWNAHRKVRMTFNCKCPARYTRPFGLRAFNNSA